MIAVDVLCLLRILYIVNRAKTRSTSLAMDPLESHESRLLILDYYFAYSGKNKSLKVAQIGKKYTPIPLPPPPRSITEYNLDWNSAHKSGKLRVDRSYRGCKTRDWRNRHLLDLHSVCSMIFTSDSFIWLFCMLVSVKISYFFPDGVYYAETVKMLENHRLHSIN